MTSMMPDPRLPSQSNNTVTVASPVLISFQVAGYVPVYSRCCVTRHSLQFALNRALFKIFGALSKDTYKDICKYFGTGPMDEQISARQSKFYFRYCATESIVCHAISKLR